MTNLAAQGWRKIAPAGAGVAQTRADQRRGCIAEFKLNLNLNLKFKIFLGESAVCKKKKK